MARHNLKSVEREFGDLPVAALSDRRVRADFLAWRDKVAVATPRAAEAKLAILARVIGWAYDLGLVSENPLLRWRRVYSSDRSEKIWLPEHVEAFEAAGPSTSLRLAFILALHTGQREGDLLRLTWKQYDGAGISLIQSKTRRPVYVPCTKALKATLDALPHPTKAVTILVGPGGLPWQQNTFQDNFARTLKAAGITAVTMLSEAGCTVPEIGTITGHSLKEVDRIIEVYLARTRTLAETAIAKLDEHLANISAKHAAKRNAGSAAK